MDFYDLYTLEQPKVLVTELDEEIQQNKNWDNIEVQCRCGNLCKGDHGLRAYQRFCQISDAPELRKLFNKDLLENSLEEYNDNIENIFIQP